MSRILTRLGRTAGQANCSDGAARSQTAWVDTLIFTRIVGDWLPSCGWEDLKPGCPLIWVEGSALSIPFCWLRMPSKQEYREPAKLTWCVYVDWAQPPGSKRRSIPVRGPYQPQKE